MKCIHGSPFGGPRQDGARFYAGRDALVPFTYPEDVGVIAAVSRSFVLDNGAFTAWKQGRPLDVPGYVAWVRVWYRHPAFEWALIPDVIDGDEAENDALLDAWPSDLARVGVPVWHMHESLERLVRLAQTYRIVALGSSGEYRSPGSATWWARMRAALCEICDEYGRPICQLHGLRMLDPRIFSRLPLSSADSTNAARNCNQLDRFGMYVPPTAAQRAAVIANRVEAHSSAPRFDWTDAELFARLEGRGFNA